MLELKLAQKTFGDEAGKFATGLGSVIFASFNQKNEAEADLMGMDLAIFSGYNPCRGIDFWKRIKTHENPQNELDNLTRSHPYSEKREQCYRDHLFTYHKLNCQP